MPSMRRDGNVQEDGKRMTAEKNKRDYKIITLCGSVKFWDEYRKWNAILTLRGYVVLSCGLSLKSGYEDILKGYPSPLDEIKQNLDYIHLRKIDLSDGIFVLNVGGYVGESTKREIAYAESTGKTVEYLEPADSMKAGVQEP